MKKAPAVEPGPGEGISENFPPDTALDPNGQHIDLRLAFLACAAARFDLVETNAMTLDEALDDVFVEQLRAVAEITCRCERDILDAWERGHRKLREQRLRNWRWRS